MYLLVFFLSRFIFCNKNLLKLLLNYLAYLAFFMFPNMCFCACVFQRTFHRFFLKKNETYTVLELYWKAQPIMKNLSHKSLCGIPSLRWSIVLGAAL